MAILTQEHREVKRQLFEAALKYLKAGRSVIPCRLEGTDSGVSKRPLVAWKKFQHCPPTEKEWQEWHRTLDYNAIGAILPPDLAVVDIDVRGPSLEDAKPYLNKLLGPGWERRYPVVQTVSGGLHVYVRTDRPVRSGPIHINGKRVGDLKGPGSLIIVPPSALDDERAYRIRNYVPLSDAPVVEAEALEGLKENGNLEEGPSGLYRLILERCPIPKGQRNDTLTSLAGVLRQGLSLPENKALDFLFWANRKFCIPPLPDPEVRAIVRSVYGYPHKPVRLDSHTRKLLEDLLRETGILPADDTPPILDFDFGISPATSTLEPQARLGDVPIFSGELVVVLGEPGSGKTTFVLRSLPDGALLIETDFGPEVFSVLGRALGMTGRVRFMHPSTPAHVAECLNQVGGQGVPLICLDTLQGITSAPETLDELVAFLHRHAQETGVPVVVVSHTNRRQDIPLHRIQGTLRLAQQATLVIEIRGWGKRPREARVLKDRYGILRNIPERWPIPGPAPPPPDPGQKKDPPPEKSAPPKSKRTLGSTLQKILALLGARGPMSALDIVRELKNVSLSAIKRVLRSPEAEPYVRIVRPGGRGRGRKTLYALKNDHACSDEASQEMNPQNLASEQAWSFSGHFTAYGEAELRNRISAPPENDQDDRGHFIAYSEADSRDFSAKWPHIIEGQGVCMSQGEGETRPEPDIGSGGVQTPVEPTDSPRPIGAVDSPRSALKGQEDIRARPPSPDDTRVEIPRCPRCKSNWLFCFSPPGGAKKRKHYQCKNCNHVFQYTHLTSYAMQ